MFTSSYPKVTLIQSKVGNGITDPKYAVLENTTNIVLKEYNGNEGNLILFNEYVSYKLAILLDLPMPESGFCIIDENTKDDGGLITKDNYGISFYSTLINKVAPLKLGIISKIQNKDIFLRLLIFDHFIYNKDRNPGNLLVQFYKNDIKLYIIDHSHVFKNEAIWDSQCLEIGIKENDYSDTQIIEKNKILYNMFFQNVVINEEKLESEKQLFQKRINYDIISKLIDECPEEIRPSKMDIDSLIKYLLYRLDNLDKIIAMIYGNLNYEI